MKYLIIILSTIVVACKPDAPNLEITGYKAGEITSQMTYHDFSPDIVLDTLPDSVTFGGRNNTLYLDLNNDSILDLRLTANSEKADFYYYLATHLMPINSNINLFSIYSGYSSYTFTNPSKNEYVCGGFTGKFKEKDVILFNGNWTPIVSIYKGFPLHNTWYSLAARSTSNEDIYKDLGDLNWRNTQNAYMGIRWIKNQDTLYGWVRMSVDGYSKITLYDCAFEKK